MRHKPRATPAQAASPDASSATSAARLLQLFSIPLAFTDDLLDTPANAAITRWVMQERARDAGVQRSIVGGWHSKPDLPMRGAPELDLLFGAMVEQVRQVHSQVSQSGDMKVRFMLQAWATVMERGHYVHIHDHADSHWSAVYYVDAGDGDDPASGRISWINPIGSHRSLPGVTLVPTTFTCTPRTGLLAVFPGWLRHSVEPYQGQRPRVVVAANIEVQRPRS